MNRIKELRKNKGIGQLELSNLLGVTQQAISIYENSTRDPDADSLKILANYFNVSIDYLLGETELNNRSDDIENLIANIREKVIEYGYEYSQKSAEEIGNIVLRVLDIAKEFKDNI